MLSDPRPIDCVGYGAISALHGVLAANLEILAIVVTHRERVDIGPFLTVADGMIDTSYSLQVGEGCRDARVQVLLLVHRYRDLIQSLASPDPELFRPAAAEFSEAQTVAAVALHKLAERLDVLPSKALSA